MDINVPIIIPSFQPDDRLLQLLDDLKKADMGQVLVVNDGSSHEYDHYFTTAQEKYGVTLLTHDVNRGKGKALKTAFSFCLEHIPGMLGCVTADSDGQHTPAAIGKMRNELINNPDSLVLGVRDFSGADIPRKSQFGNNLTRKVFHLLYKKDISDTQTGLRAISKAFMQDLLSVSGDRFEFETKMLIVAVENSISIVEIPIETIYDSKENHSTHFRPIVDSARIYYVFGSAFIKFILSSASSGLIDLGLFHIFCILLREQSQGAQYVALATVLARVFSAIYNYSINYYFVFKSKKSHAKSSIKYFVLAVLQMLCSAFLTTTIVALLGATVELAVKIPVDLILFFASYKIQRKFIY